jgi:hypothetical protein
MADELMIYKAETFERLIEKFKFKNDLYGVILRADYNTLTSIMYALSDPSKPVAKLLDYEMNNYKSLTYGGPPGRFNLFCVKFRENTPKPCDPFVSLQMEGCVEETRLAFKAAEELIIAEGFKAPKDYCNMDHYPVSYTEKGASFFCGDSFNKMFNHFEHSIARYANREEQVADIRKIFLTRIEKRGLEKYVPGAPGRENFKPDDVAGFLRQYVGNFKIVGGCREVSDFYAACGCEVCDAKEIDSSYEFVIRLNTVEDPTTETQYFGIIVDICSDCTAFVLKETNLFEDGQKDYDAVFN